MTLVLEYVTGVPSGTVAATDGLMERAVPELLEVTEYVPKLPRVTLKGVMAGRVDADVQGITAAEFTAETVKLPNAPIVALPVVKPETFAI